MYGRYSVHIPSLASPREVVDGATQYEVYRESEGYVVDVYENGIVLRGRDFVNDLFLPVATFYLDTTLQAIEEEAYYDLTGTIISKNSLDSAILPADTTWMVNKCYSGAVGSIIDANSYELFLIPCPGVGVTPCTLQIKNANIDLERRKSANFLFDSEQKCIDEANGNGFFSKMSNVEMKEDGLLQVNFVPTKETAYIMVSIEEKAILRYLCLLLTIMRFC